jgi:predicted acylesterase/phospholipase RssA
VFAPLMAPGGVGRFMRYIGEFLPVSSIHAPSILHPEPLGQTLGKLVDFDQLDQNIHEQRLALGVVATPAHSNSSVVFHQGGIPRHRGDPLRGIEYVATAELSAEHILASSAIPALFPAVRVTTPNQAAGWYYDGGPRLTTPIKPALWLGAKRVIVIALNSVAPSRTPPPEHQPDFYVGAAHLLHDELPVLRRRVRRATDQARPSRRAALDRRAPRGPLATKSATRLDPSTPPQHSHPEPAATSTSARSREGARHPPVRREQPGR